MSYPLNRTLLVPSLMVGLGIALAGFFIGKMHYNAKVAINTAEAKGLSERRVEADTANWTISYSVAGATREDVPALYAKAEANQEAIIETLTKGGIKREEIQLGVINYSSREFRDKDQNLVDETHYLTGTVTVETNDVRMVQDLRSSVNKLVAQGMDVTNQAPTYLFTKLNDIKPEMLKEAARNARIAANEFAENAGVNVGGIRSARQGAFMIVDVGSSHGDTRKIAKDVRVVTTVQFFLVD